MQRLIRATCQTLSRSKIDFFNTDSVDLMCPKWLPLPKCSISPPPIAQPGHFVRLLLTIFNIWNLIWQPPLPERYWSGSGQAADWNLALIFICLCVIPCPITWHLHPSHQPAVLQRILELADWCRWSDISCSWSWRKDAEVRCSDRPAVCSESRRVSTHNLQGSAVAISALSLYECYVVI